MNLAEINTQSTKLLTDLQLLEKKNSLTKHLSGGQKRKLSVGIALLGNPKLVMLDEPTSGMDATARREFWDMLKKYKKDKIIILTTHYMEEADYLGDRIAIMAFGKLRCCGTSLFLKGRFGIGYNLHILKEQFADSGEIIQFVHERVPDSEKQSDIGTEILIRLPFSSAGQFKSLFKDLDEYKSSLNIESYGISVTTLEDVFLRVAMLEEIETHTRLSLRDNVARESSKDVSLSTNIFSVADSPPSTFKTQTMAIVKKRYIESKRSVSLICFEFVLPLILVLIGLSAFVLSTKPREHIYSISDFPTPQRPIINKNTLIPNSMDIESYFGNFGNGNIKSEYIYFTGDINSRNNTKDTLTEYSNIIYNRTWNSGDIHPYRYGSYLIAGNPRPNVTTGIVFFNYTTPQTLFPFTNLLHQQIIRQVTNKSNISIKIKIQQMKTSGGFIATLANSAEANQFSSFCALAFSFIPGLVAAYMVKERNFELKHLQLTSGMSLFSYWLINYIIELVFMMVPVCIVIIIYNAFQLDVKYYIYIYI